MLALRQILALGISQSVECIQRPSTILLATLVALSMVLNPFLSVFALGDEYFLFKELCLSNLVLGGAIAAVFCAVPAKSRASVSAADSLLATRAVDDFVLVSGRWAGIVATVSALFLLWGIAVAIGLILFFANDKIVVFRGDDVGVIAGFNSMAIPTLLVWVQTLMVAALALWLSTKTNLTGTVIVVSLFLVVCLLVPDQLAGQSGALSVLSWLVPDLRVYASSETLSRQSLGLGWVTGATIQSLAVAIFFLWMAKGLVREN